MVTHPQTNRIQIATAIEVAANLPYPHTTSGGWWRTSTAICHGGDNKNALSFQDGERPGDSPLRVHCHSHNCDATAIRHALQQATGLWLCRCAICFAAFRAGQPSPGANETPPAAARRPQTQRDRTQHPRKNEKTTADYAAKLWAAARVSTSGPDATHPAAKWLAERNLWPAGEPLPEAVRWLPRTQLPKDHDNTTAAGALIMAMRPLSDLTAAPRKAHLVAIDAAGRKAYHWQPDKGGDKRTYGEGPAYGLLWKERPDGSAPCDLHVVEGLADGLALLRMLSVDHIVAVCAGTGYGRVEPAWFSSVTLWPDSDQAGLAAAKKTAQQWADQGYTITIKRLPEDHDPASINWKTT